MVLYTEDRCSWIFIFLMFRLCDFCFSGFEKRNIIIIECLLYSVLHTFFFLNFNSTFQIIIYLESNICQLFTLLFESVVTLVSQSSKTKN